MFLLINCERNKTKCQVFKYYFVLIVRESFAIKSLMSVNCVLFVPISEQKLHLTSFLTKKKDFLKKILLNIISNNIPGLHTFEFM